MRPRILPVLVAFALPLCQAVQADVPELILNGTDAAANGIIDADSDEAGAVIADGDRCSAPPFGPPVFFKAGHGGAMMPPPGMPGPLPGMPGPPPPPCPSLFGALMHAFVASGETLSDDQVEKIAQLKRAMAQKMAPVKARIHSLENDIGGALTDPEVNAGEIKALSAKLSSEKRQMEDLMTEHAVSVAQVMTAEQRRHVKLTMDRQELGPLGREHPNSRTAAPPPGH